MRNRAAENARKKNQEISAEKIRDRGDTHSRRSLPPLAPENTEEGRGGRGSRERRAHERMREGRAGRRGTSSTSSVFSSLGCRTWAIPEEVIVGKNTSCARSSCLPTNWLKKEGRKMRESAEAAASLVWCRICCRHPLD
jgi:hypothetical protein